MGKPLPSWSQLWNNYPNESNPRIVIDSIFANKHNYNWIKNNIQNICTIRLSRAFNATGDPIKKIPGLSILIGNDKKRYAYRVSEITRYLENIYGPPTVSKESEEPEALRKAVQGKRGIIIFKVKGWEEATGHADLWDGAHARYREYFHKAHKVLLWQIDRGASGTW